VLAAVRFAATTVADLAPSGVLVVLHDVRDPGNAGTVIRTADAAGATAVVLSGHSVDPYNPKTLRATAGSIFHLPVLVAEELSEVIRWFKAGSGRCVATVCARARTTESAISPVTSWSSSETRPKVSPTTWWRCATSD
jgi:TrmH family RNA methyltransferase